MSAEERINSLLEIHPKGFDLSLDRFSALLMALGNPQDRIPPVIHVAGTNGKGSTVAFCRAILEASSHAVHVHTSPHLVNWHERFRIGKRGGGQLVLDAVLEDAITRAARANGGQQITIFEILTAAMFLLFSEHPADFSLIEVGLGGRFDATNVIESPAVCIITPIALDHQSYLGDTVAAIAFEKAGIIKPGAKIVVGPQQEDCLAVIEAKARECGAETFVAGRDFDFFNRAGRFIYQDNEGLLDLSLPKLVGEHQLANAAQAIAAIRAIGIAVTDTQYETAMRNVSWPGRMQRLKSGEIVKRLGPGTEIWIDGGHNPSAGIVVAEELTRQNRQTNLPTVMVCAMLTTKEPAGYFKAFEGLVDEVITVPVQSSDAGFDPHELASIAADAGLQACSKPDLEGAITALEIEGGKGNRRILFAGTLYLAGEVLAKNKTPPR